jgi:hypothetical protein
MASLASYLASLWQPTNEGDRGLARDANGPAQRAHGARAGPQVSPAPQRALAERRNATAMAIHTTARMSAAPRKPFGPAPPSPTGPPKSRGPNPVSATATRPAGNGGLEAPGIEAGARLDQASPTERLGGR